jgi:hypothetical protein
VKSVPLRGIAIATVGPGDLQPFIGSKEKIMKFTWMLSALLACGLACQARAEEKGEVLFADNFATLDPGWGDADDEVLGVQNKKLVFQFAQAGDKHALYQGKMFEDADIRVMVNQTSGEAARGAGIAFWCDNLRGYVAKLRSDGNFRLENLSATPLSPPVHRMLDKGVKKGLNQVNELRVVTKGMTATIYVNGQEVASLKAKRKYGSMVGLVASSGAVPCRWEFSDFVIRKPE